MKKLFTLVVVVLMVVGAKAQTEIVIGPKVGLNMTNISNSDKKNKLSFHVGGFAEFRFNDYFAIQPELVYSRQGARDKINGDKLKLRANYLNIPVLAKLYVLDELSVDLGPEFGFALNAKAKYKDGDTTVKHKMNDINTLAVNFAIGLSYNWDDFMFSARYNLGLSNAFDKDNYDGNNKNRVFQLSVGNRSYKKLPVMCRELFLVSSPFNCFFLSVDPGFRSAIVLLYLEPVEEWA